MTVQARSSSRETVRIAGAMVAAGFSTFAMMNAVQPLMPIFSLEFGISAASASLSLSVTIAALALAMIASAGLSDRFGRKPVMVASLWLSSGMMIATGFVSDWSGLLVLRALSGLAMAGVPAVAITWIAEEVSAHDRAKMNGIYVSGAAFGGMAGRLLAGGLATPLGWHGALIAIGFLGIATAIAFAMLLPASRNFRPDVRDPKIQAAAFLHHLRDPVQRRLYLSGALLMGALVSLYNYLGYRLSAPPFSLPPALIGALFLFYATGMFSATASGRLQARFGMTLALRLSVLLAVGGIGLMLSGHLMVILIGLVAFTMGFFAAHALASGATARLATEAKTQAATLYLLSYYMGGATIGWVSGHVWQLAGWSGLSGTLIFLLLAVVALTPSRKPNMDVT